MDSEAKAEILIDKNTDTTMTLDMYFEVFFVSRFTHNNVK